MAHALFNEVSFWWCMMHSQLSPSFEPSSFQFLGHTRAEYSKSVGIVCEASERTQP